MTDKTHIVFIIDKSRKVGAENILRNGVNHLIPRFFRILFTIHVRTYISIRNLNIKLIFRIFAFGATYVRPQIR